MILLDVTPHVQTMAERMTEKGADLYHDPFFYILVGFVTAVLGTMITWITKLYNAGQRSVAVQRTAEKESNQVLMAMSTNLTQIDHSIRTVGAGMNEMRTQLAEGQRTIIGEIKDLERALK